MTTHLQWTASHRVLAPSFKKPVHALLQIQCPASSTSRPAKRPSLNMALTLDVSGSMSGKPLQDAVAASLLLLDQLQPSDRISLVIYSTTARVLAASAPATTDHKGIIRTHLLQLQANGSTALHEGWLTAAQSIAPFVSDYAISRVLLLSDGQATHGVMGPDQLRSQSQELLEAGISTSTYGVGFSFNENIMTALAQGGQAFYAQSSAELHGYFENELQLMVNTAIRQVRVQVSCQSGSQEIPYKVLGDVSTIKDQYVLPNIVLDGEGWLVVELTPADRLKKDLTLTATIHYVDTQDVAHVDSVSLVLAVRNKAVANALSKTVTLRERKKELDAAQLQKEAIKAAQRGDWNGVNGMMRSLSGMALGNAYVEGVANTMSALAATKNANLFAKEATYSSNAMSTRQTVINEDVGSLQDRLGLKRAQQGKSQSPSAPQNTPGEQP